MAREPRGNMLEGETDIPSNNSDGILPVIDIKVYIDNEDKNNIIGKSSESFWKEKMVELGGDYLIWSNAPENPSYN